MTTFICLLTALASAAELPSEDEELGFSRDAQGVAAALSDHLNAYQDCFSSLEGEHTIRVHFIVNEEGRVEDIQAIATERNRDLKQCLATPLEGLQFAPGNTVMPVEIPFQIEAQEDVQVVSAEDYRQDHLASAE